MIISEALGLFHRLIITKDPAPTIYPFNLLFTALMNNAAIGGFMFKKSIDEKLPQQEREAILQNNLTESYEKALDCFQTNYYGVKNMMEVFLPLVQLSNFGRTVNVSTKLAQLQNMNNEKLRNELMDIDIITVERIEDLAEPFLKSVKDDNSLEENKWTS